MAKNQPGRKRAKPRRRAVDPDVRQEVLRRCRRRCCVCFGLRGDLDVKNGQLAHLDRNPRHSTPENLAFLCQECHTDYDKKSNRVLGFTPEEVRHYRDQLHAALGHDQFEWSLTIQVDQGQFAEAKRVVDEAHAVLRTFTKSVIRREGPAKS